jgi:hypothetical protein
MNNVFLSRLGLLLLLQTFALQPSAHAETTFSVGQKVDAGAGYRHKATVLQAKSPSYFLHYDDGSLPDGWEQGYSIRPRTGGSESGTASAKAGANGASGPSASAVQGGPRNGKYTIYAYSTYGRAMYDGYFVLNSGLYELFLPGGKSGGNGRCSFDADTGTMHWVSGPFANPDWNGTQRFEVDGKNQKIRLRRNTVGWSTGS